ncbi:DUF2934 family protein [Rhizobium sp. ERR 922]|uniref:DUF2934 domain-containing protein n=1 Tax=Rhizobium dioscoreae TaxID=2653122 RepID=A0ABQ0Z739_9HYPH|nr:MULTISPECIES: DUF2934 domain-containing protein [Rhizobium]MCZ3379245.1 DUF2934 domain-containing protein [Rhizobium sp. AG207R]TWB13258.1 DUF2934 family protein [Rhizobium sp. ERR1071]TWB53415.1 DUF2934 family protein [Rhizobium sp. ERR 922]TWB95621.1 DUF2934 family protein [Rhizobium sp. ERR 942]GES40964.1 hypothetical protein RsS62_02160 [Rhizobium dioscoreae]
MDDDEAKRRERAYRIWEEEGRPDGRDLDHWQRAEEQHQETEREAETSPVSKGKGKKAAYGRPIRE